ncbi:hypothetical protein [Nocardioides sp. GY 10127]|uniref:hypothetical protein n=1 Tax=Nocardioides sp. GY 10127 TaxID=2569762 RepID=UPI0010A8D582|nr:hypothetical protein [Nocardioides sp. GY 10127]TIC78922.1 hypothetical protein E8D37_18780 [Nocardioides sp. GY 10127]
MFWGGTFHLGASRRARRATRPALGLALGVTLTTTLALALGPLATVTAEAGTTTRAGSFTTGANNPTAVAVTKNGITYAGFRNGGTLRRVGKGGKKLSPLVLDQPDAVTALAAGSKNSIWVLYGRSVSQINRKGVVLRHWLVRPEVWCPATVGHDPAIYGGITVRGSTVYVANRCKATLQSYTLGGVLKATVRLPGGKSGGGVTIKPGAKNSGPEILVALPAKAEIAAYDLATFSDGDKPRSTIAVPKASGGVTPVPTDVVADKTAQVTVLDTANNAIYLMDSTNKYSVYRTLGHPTEASSKMGWLDLPTALAQYPQTGHKMSGNLYIADSRNGRVQRWSTTGRSYWATATKPGKTNPDSSEPTSCSSNGLTINRGAKYSTTHQVMLRVSTPSGATEIEIANNKDFDNSWITDVKDSCLYDWYTGNDGRVFVRFPGSSSDNVWKSSIVVDTVAPDIKSAVKCWSNKKSTWRLVLAAKDKKSGLRTVSVAKTKGHVKRTRKWANVLESNDGSVFTWVRATDAAGNTSFWTEVKTKASVSCGG